MSTWIALFRGINVGGHHKLPMKDLKALMAGLGFADVRTYIQSGNAVFESDETEPAVLGERIADAVERSQGFRTWVLVLSREAFMAAVAANPFPDAEAAPKTLHLSFLAAPATVDPAALDAVKADDEEWVLTDRVLYFHAPRGIGRSKLAAKMDRLLGVEMTTRNWRTVVEVAEMAG
jgi:uncharacterized protein (DUF1697 family)